MTDRQSLEAHSVMSDEGNAQSPAADALDLMAQAYSGTVGTVHRVHDRISARSRWWLGPRSGPLRVLEGRVRALTYANVAVVGAAVFGTAKLAVRAPGAREHADRAVASSPVADRVRGAVNGIYGDRLDQAGHSFGMGMSVREGDRDVEITEAGLRRAFPAAGGDITLFAHGLCATETNWRLHGRKHYQDPRSTHGSRLAAELGTTAVWLRYNSGRSVTANGAELAALLDQLITAWPVPVESLSLVGHSMGGLLISAARSHAVRAGHGWPGLLRRIAYLGTPHQGAWLAKTVHAASAALSVSHETRPIADVLETRSAGVRDLRAGYFPAPHSAPAGPDHRVRVLHVAATYGADPGRFAARVAGDLMVSKRSASKARPDPGFPHDDATSVCLGGLAHPDLLNHPRVYDVLRAWASGQPVPSG